MAEPCSHEWTLEPEPGVAECAKCGERMSREVQYHEKLEQVCAILADAPVEGE